MQNHFTNEQAHNAARLKADNLRKKILECTVLFSDGSIDTELFYRAKCEFKYKTPDGETYLQEYDSALFSEPFFSDRDIKQKEVKTGYEKWLYENNPMESIVSIKWKLIEA